VIFQNNTKILKIVSCNVRLIKIILTFLKGALPMKNENFLTENKLVEIMKTEFGAENVISQYKFGRRKVDCKVTVLSKGLKIPLEIDERHVPEKIELLIEYDGHYHYLSNYTVFKDSPGLTWRKLKTGEFQLRIPYWIQLDNRLMKHCFGIDKDYSNGYPQGFISNQVILPDRFTSLAESRFLTELATLPAEVAFEVYESLLEKVKKYNAMRVCSSRLWLKLLCSGIDEHRYKAFESILLAREKTVEYEKILDPISLDMLKNDDILQYVCAFEL